LYVDVIVKEFKKERYLFKNGLVRMSDAIEEFRVLPLASPSDVPHSFAVKSVR
jgi:hypothetical protein